MRIGVCDLSVATWTSGTEYTRAQLAALLAVRDECGIDLAVVRRGPAGVISVAGHEVPTVAPPPDLYPRLPTRLADRAVRGRRPHAVSHVRHWRRWRAQSRFDLLLSFAPAPWWQPCEVATCTWLWDFQHRVLPQMFADERLVQLDELFRRWSERTDLSVVSSEAARRDFAEFAPDLVDKARIYRFASRFAFQPDHREPTPVAEVLGRFGIDPRYLLVVNQFWRHKNHETVVEAARILRDRTGSCPPIVMIGNPYDDRDPSGAYLSQVLSRIAEYRLEGCVKVLGFVSADDRDALFRGCTALVQPSRFEGWNTSIEDAKAIGRPVIASSLDVHLEQLPHGFGFFDTDDPAGLADLMARTADLPAGPQPSLEQEALARSRADLVTTGRELFSICQEARALADRRMGKPAHASV